MGVLPTLKGSRETYSLNPLLYEAVRISTSILEVTRLEDRNLDHKKAFREAKWLIAIKKNPR